MDEVDFYSFKASSNNPAAVLQTVYTNNKSLGSFNDYVVDKNDKIKLLMDTSTYIQSKAPFGLVFNSGTKECRLNFAIEGIKFKPVIIPDVNDEKTCLGEATTVFGN